MTPATSPDEGAERGVDAALDLTDAEQRQARRDELRGEHEKTQLQLMRLLDQIREVRAHGARAGGTAAAARWTDRTDRSAQDTSTNQFHYLNRFPIDDFPANPYHLKVCAAQPTRANQSRSTVHAHDSRTSLAMPFRA